MTKLGVDSLNSTVEAIINNEKERGTIIAIATYTDRQQVCFLKLGKDQGKDHGEWIPVSALVGGKPPLPQRDDSDLDSAKKQAEEDINSLLRYTQKISRDISNKVGSDLELISKAIKEFQILAEEDITDKENISLAKSKQWLNELIEKFGKTIDSITDTINRYLNKYWLPRLVSVFNKLADAELAKAKQEVIDLRKEYPDYQPSQIAQELITEKTIFATTTGIISDGLKIVNPIVGEIVDLTKNLALLVEMIYQIGIAYGFEEIEDGENLGILATAFTAERLRQLGLEILLKQVPFVNLMITASSNIALFQLVGFTACKYYEAKANKEANPLTSKEAYLKLEKQLDAYLTETLSEKETLNQLSRKVIAIRQEVVM